MNYLGALGAGYTTQQILNYISQSFPEMGPRIKEALATGKSADEIMKYLGKFDKKQLSSIKGNSKPIKPFPGVGYQSQYAQADEATKEMNPIPDSLQTAGKLALPIAGAALGAPLIRSAASKAGPMLQKAMQHAAPSLFGPGAISNPGTNHNIGNSLPHNTSQTQTPSQLPNMATHGQKPLSQPQPPVDVSGILTQTGNAQQPEGISTSKKYLESLGILDKVDDLLARGNSPEEAAAALGIQRSGISKIDPQLVSAIDGYLKEGGSALSPPHSMPDKKVGIPTENIQPQPEMTENVQKVSEITPENVQNPVEQPKPIEKGSLASSAHGLGDVLEIRNGQAIIDVDGKKHKVNVEDLEAPLFDENEIADAYDDLMAKIPEKHRSGFVSWAGYDDDRNVLGFIPRGGKYEELSDITPEEARLIKEGKGVARTTGANREGLWAIGEDTRGGIISQIIHDRRKKSKSSSENQGSFPFEIAKAEKQDRGMKPIFDEMAHARELSREREKKKKIEERERQKRERDEAKKRKK